MGFLIKIKDNRKKLSSQFAPRYKKDQKSIWINNLKIIFYLNKKKDIKKILSFIINDTTLKIMINI